MSALDIDKYYIYNWHVPFVVKANFIKIGENFSFGTKFHKFVILGSWWLPGGYCSLPSGYCLLLLITCWLLVVTARYCLFPLLVWMLILRLNLVKVKVKPIPLLVIKNLLLFTHTHPFLKTFTIWWFQHK